MKKGVISFMGMVIMSLFLVGCGNNDDVNNDMNNLEQDGRLNNNIGNQDQARVDDDIMNDNDLDMEMNNGLNDDRDMKTDAVTEGNYEYSFQKFELDVDYPDMEDAIEVEYDNEPGDEFEASYEDRTQDIRIHGDEAMNKLDKIFSTFDFDENTAEDEVLDAVVEAFEIRDDARKVELEIEFNNGVEKEYRR